MSWAHPRDYQVLSWSHWINHWSVPCPTIFWILPTELITSQCLKGCCFNSASSLCQLGQSPLVGGWTPVHWLPAQLPEPAQQAAARCSTASAHGAYPSEYSFRTFFMQPCISMMRWFQWPHFMAKLDSRLAVLLKLSAGNGSLSTSHLSILKKMAPNIWPIYSQLKKKKNILTDNTVILLYQSCCYIQFQEIFSLFSLWINFWQVAFLCHNILLFYLSSRA